MNVFSKYFYTSEDLLALYFTPPWVKIAQNDLSQLHLKKFGVKIVNYQKVGLNLVSWKLLFVTLILMTKELARGQGLNF